METPELAKGQEECERERGGPVILLSLLVVAALVAGWMARVLAT